RPELARWHADPCQCGIRQMILLAYPGMHFVGLPEWTRTARYYVTASTDAGTHPTSEHRVEMIRNLLVQRMHLTAHIDRDGETTLNHRPQRAADAGLARAGSGASAAISDSQGAGL